MNDHDDKPDKPQRNDINALRDHLFATLRALRDKDAPMDVDRARVISQVAGTLIESARVEVDYMRVARSQGSGFLEPERPTPDKPQNGIVGITRHLLGDE